MKLERATSDDVQSDLNMMKSVFFPFTGPIAPSAERGPVDRGNVQNSLGAYVHAREDRTPGLKFQSLIVSFAILTPFYW